jgi:mannan polymerase II complex MNN10 subunit
LPSIPGTPLMSLSRSPSPQPGGGWASPGLTSPFGEGSGSTTPRNAYRAHDGSSVSWESAKAKTEGVNGYPSFSTHNNGFFNRHYRKISSSLPRFNMGSDKSYAEKEKLGRGRWSARGGSRLARLRSMVRQASRKTKIRFLIGLALLALFIIYQNTRRVPSPPSKAQLTLSSNTVLVAQVETLGRGQEVRDHPSSKSRWRGDGVEGGARVGYRAR